MLAKRNYNFKNFIEARIKTKNKKQIILNMKVDKIILEETQKSEEIRITIAQEEKWYKKIFLIIKNLFKRK